MFGQTANWDNHRHADRKRRPRIHKRCPPQSLAFVYFTLRKIDLCIYLGRYTHRYTDTQISEGPADVRRPCQTVLQARIPPPLVGNFCHPPRSRGRRYIIDCLIDKYIEPLFDRVLRPNADGEKDAKAATIYMSFSVQTCHQDDGRFAVVESTLRSTA